MTLVAQLPPAAGAPSLPSSANDPGARQGGDANSPFGSLLDQYATGDPAAQASPNGAAKAGGAPNREGATRREKGSVSSGEAAQDPNAAAQGGLAAAADPTAALAALVSSPAIVEASADAIDQSVASTDAGRRGAMQLLAARLMQQAAGDGAAMPSDATAELALGGGASVAPPTIEVSVQKARTYLGLDNVGRSVQATIGQSTIAPADPTLAAAQSLEAAAKTVATTIANDDGETTATAASAEESGEDAAARPAKIATASAAPAPLRPPGAAPQGADAHGASSGGANRGAGGGRPNPAASTVLSGEKSQGVSNLAADAANGAVSFTDASAIAGGGTLVSASLDRLPQVIADQARSLGTTSSGSGVGATPVKELDVQLNPASLGSLTVKMRLAEGKLSVTIETANSATAKLIDSAREAIAERLSAVDQPVASIEVKSSENTSAQSENGNANGSAVNQQSDGGGAAPGGNRGENEAARSRLADPSDAQAEGPETNASQRARLGDLFV
jgi:chemotaxis protein MotD